SLNPCVLDEKDCYASHIVVVTKVTDSSVTFHDPGLPPQENREVAKEIFEKAMTPPAKEDTNVIALRKRD
ncbi:MAG: hypothetical protein GWN55_17305, partial [Phycisphaerae bacterium]|nr:hypothetical protein [Phycisphaerae bacterium]NIV71094.1 hypothetical protein [Phycisphaerae bacterium]